MCSGSPGHSLDWACDDCFGRYTQHKGLSDDFVFCDECKRVMKQMCWVCMCQSDDVEDGICKSCRDEDDDELYEKDFSGVLEFGQRITFDPDEGGVDG